MTTISTLQEVQTWLGTLTVGQQTSVGSSMFSSTPITSLFGMLPGSDPIALTITAIDTTDPTKAILSGNQATVLGEADSSVVFTFTQPASVLLMQLDLTPPSSLEWTLINSWNVGFGSLAAHFVPNTNVGTNGITQLVFDAAINAGTSPNNLSLPISLQVPSWSGDWMVSGNFESIGSLADDALTALLGGNSMTQMLQGAFPLSNFSLTDVEVTFNPTKNTVSLIALSLSYNTKWTFFNGGFEVDSLNFSIQLQQPFVPGAMSFQGVIDATMEIPANSGNKFDVGLQFPDYAVFAQIPDGGSINLTDIFTYFKVPLPSGFPNIVLDTLSFTFLVGANTFNFHIGIHKPFEIIGNVQLNNFDFSLSVAYANSAYSGSGALSTSFTLGTGPTATTLNLSGAYTSGQGLTLAGSATNIQLGQIIDDIAAQFGIPATSIPAPINNLVIETLGTDLTTGTTNKFDFSLVGTTTISGVKVKFSPVITATWGGAGFSGTFGGQLVLSPTDGSGDITFTLEFSTSPTDTWMQATYHDAGNGLQFGTLASVFGFTLPPIPPDLDLDLTDATLWYDFTSGQLAFGLKSKNYGCAAYVRVPVGQTPTTADIFILDTNQTFSLSSLPLVGAELAQIENIQVQNLSVTLTDTTIATTDVGTVNNVIGKVQSTVCSTLPKIPATGLSGTALITAGLQFGNDPPTPLSVSIGGTNTESTALVATYSAATPSTTSSDGVSWFTVQKTFGPIAIQRIGVMYQSSAQTLWFEIDASLTFGPLTLSLVGLGIGSQVTNFSPQFSLSGLGISYSNPPLTIGGAFVNLAPPGASYIDFEGAVSIGTGEFTLQAFGMYSNQPGYSTMFIFGDLAYPFGGPPAFFVTGVALGFGYNSNVTIPTIDQVSTFPFVQVLPTSTVPNTGALGGPNATPMEVLQKLIPKWVQPQQGQLWFAAGITFTSFELVNSQAMLLVEAGNNLVIALIGTSRATFPQGSDASSAYAYVELDIEIFFAPSEGVFSVQAVLAPSSFLLTKACVLQGGFAFFVWYNPSPYAGDFVVTLGGYNPGFTPPSYYPKVSAVGFHWSVDSSITITGGVYFALTPAALMAGGQLSATYQSGNLKAWFDAHADLIVRWKPFSFDASIGITIGASYKLDLLFTTCTVKVEMGCNLEFYGPPTGGSVEVDWYIISFTIPFGASRSGPPKANDWSDVNALLPNTSNGGNPISISPAAGLTTSTTSPSGSNNNSMKALASPDDNTVTPWLVRGSQFSFSTSTPIPGTNVTVGGLIGQPVPANPSWSFNGSQFQVFPLGWSGVSASHTVNIVDSGNTTDYSNAFQAVQVQNGVPASLWGAPPVDDNGNQVTPSGDNQVVPGQIVGVNINVLPPQIGASAGQINSSQNLAALVLPLTGANLPLSNQAQPTGDIATNSDSTVATIKSGIASSSSISTRSAIFTALQTLGYAPVTPNDSMTNFANSVGCAFTAEPLLVP